MRLSSLWLLLVFLAGCAGTDEAGEKKRRPRPIDRIEQASTPTLALAPTDSLVRTIQLYRTGDERNLPVLAMGTSETLTLAFDLLERGGRPLSVYFYHANRTWTPDLVPAEYMTSFQHDNLFDYTPSLGTDIGYTHYSYRFPNQSIDFRISGNYVVRVTEQGQEEAVLFEVPFFVSEEIAAIDLTLGNVLLAGQGFGAVQPVALITPPQNLMANAFDYSVCFVRNGRYQAARCTDNPRLNQHPALEFYLEPQSAFGPEGADYFLDLSNLRVGSRIAATNLTRSPFRVRLEPDYAQFAGSGLDPVLNGQAVRHAAGRGFNEPHLDGEYVMVEFGYVPPEEQPLPGQVIVTGGFNGWQIDPRHRLTWQPERGRYTGEVLLKQGQYEYRYYLTDRDTRTALQHRLPRPDNLYMAFVYYDDLRYQTDRLVATRGLLSH